jgi:hypothetical protein
MVIATGVNERTGAAVGQATHLRILGQTSVREEEIMGSHSKNSPLNRQSRAEHLDKLLDEALEQTFPASDPSHGVETKSIRTSILPNPAA